MKGLPQPKRQIDVSGIVVTPINLQDEQLTFRLSPLIPDMPRASRKQ